MNIFSSGKTAENIYESVADLPVYDVHTRVDQKMILDNQHDSDP